MIYIYIYIFVYFLCIFIYFLYICIYFLYFYIFFVYFYIFFVYFYLFLYIFICCCRKRANDLPPGVAGDGRCEDKAVPCVIDAKCMSSCIFIVFAPKLIGSTAQPSSLTAENDCSSQFLLVSSGFLSRVPGASLSACLPSSLLCRPLMHRRPSTLPPGSPEASVHFSRLRRLGCTQRASSGNEFPGP